MNKIKNLQKVATRLKKAIKNRERILLYGDADLDGATSVIILEDAIRTLGGEIEAVYFPDREREGYGINEAALIFLKKSAPAILITLDCGIGNFREIEIAKKLAFETIIIDHHEIVGPLPKADIIVNPKQKGDLSSFKKFATCGLVFKLVKKMICKDLPSLLEKNFLELTALGTIADMMPEIGENKILVKRGLETIDNSFRPGLRALWEIAKNQQKLSTKEEIIRKIISISQISKIKNHLTKTYLTLSAKNKKIAEKLAKELLIDSLERNRKIKEILNEIKENICKKEAFVFQGEKDWPLALTGTIASRLLRKLKKPIFIFKKGKEISRGSVRAPENINSIEAMNFCKKYLITFGGHPPASGFTILTKNLENFKECLKEYFSKNE